MVQKATIQINYPERAGGDWAATGSFAIAVAYGRFRSDIRARGSDNRRRTVGAIKASPSGRTYSFNAEDHLLHTRKSLAAYFAIVSSCGNAISSSFCAYGVGTSAPVTLTAGASR